MQRLILPFTSLRIASQLASYPTTCIKSKHQFKLTSPLASSGLTYVTKLFMVSCASRFEQDYPIQDYLKTPASWLVAYLGKLSQ